MSQELTDMLNAAFNFGEKSTREDKHAAVVIGAILGASVNGSLPKLSTLCIDFVTQELLLIFGNQQKGK